MQMDSLHSLVSRYLDDEDDNYPLLNKICLLSAAQLILKSLLSQRKILKMLNQLVN